MKYLVVGATGHVGSKIARLLAAKGFDVTALVRRRGTGIEDPYEGVIAYAVGDLTDEDSMRRALVGIDVVIFTANGIAPHKKGEHARSVSDGGRRFIALCEEAGVERFVLSSVPTYERENDVPELKGKRLLERRLAESSMQSIVVRNPAFMDVWLVLGGFGGAEDKSRHATTKRNYGLLRFYTKLVGGLVERHGIFIAPGGAHHGSPLISTRDAAEMIVGAALHEGSENLLVEAGGPEWLSWLQIAAVISGRVGRHVRIVPLPAWLLRLNQALVAPFSEAAANIFGLMGFVAAYQPRWNSEEVVRTLRLPKQMSVADYLDENYVRNELVIARAKAVSESSAALHER